MFITKQDDYDNFICIAGDCPDTCCTGWDIMIDDDSLQRYTSYEGELGAFIKSQVDFENKCFKHNGTKCALINEEGLCTIQKNYGEEGLCRTCDRYPRHIEEFEDVEEYSLSLSCPEAARMMLLRKEPMSFSESEVPDREDYEEDEEFDFFLYTTLNEVRVYLYQIIQNRSLSIPVRMGRILQIAGRLEELYDEGQLFEAGELSKQSFEDMEFSYEEDKELFSHLYDIEFLAPDWKDILDGTWNEIVNDKSNYDMAIRSMNSKEGSLVAENIMMFFVYSYFCGAVYDEYIFSKVALAVHSTRWIFMVKEYAYTKGLRIPQNVKADTEELRYLIWASYRFAREIEHSNENLEALNEILAR